MSVWLFNVSSWNFSFIIRPIRYVIVKCFICISALSDLFFHIVTMTSLTHKETFYSVING